MPGQDERPGNLTTDHALAWLADDSIARVMLDDQQMVLWSNGAADTLFSRRAGLEIRGSMLCASDPVCAEAFLGFLASCAVAAATWCIKQPKQDGWLLLRGRCLNAATKVIGLCLTDASDRRSVTYEQLDVAFGLTRAEHRILLDLLEGNDAETLAARHGLSLDTIRSHIRHIYSKLGVRSRESLFACLQHFRT